MILRRAQEAVRAAHPAPLTFNSQPKQESPGLRAARLALSLSRQGHTATMLQQLGIYRT
jgi:hypothetical protein